MMVTLDCAMTNQQPGYIKQVKDLQIGEKVKERDSILTVVGNDKEKNLGAVTLTIDGEDGTIYPFMDYSDCWLKEVK